MYFQLPGTVLRALLPMCAALLLHAGAVFADGRIAVVISGAGAPYDETLGGLKQHLAAKGVAVEYVLMPLNGDAARAAQAAQELKRSAPKLIVTLGSIATEAVLKEIADIPVVAAMILKADTLKKSENATGVVLEIPIPVQLQWIRKVIPKASTVGVIYNPAENREKVESAGKLAQKQGISIAGEEVRGPTEIPAALDRLAKKADALWGMADSTVLTSQTAKYILLFSFRNKIPLIGPSSAWVKAGALYSLDWDYADLGAQCGEAAFKVLQGTPPGAVPIGVPRKVTLSLNRKTAEEMSLSLPADVVKEAHTTY